MEDFEQLHRDHKHLDAEHKKLIMKGDQQKEKLRELQNRGIGGRADQGGRHGEGIGRNGNGPVGAQRTAL